MTVPEKIKTLVETFHSNLESYKHGNYNETQVRREFIDPFFEELGWDITNKNGYSEAYKDVIHEDAIKIGGITKAPDYCFRIGGVRKFFLEAKKPAVNIKDDIHPAYQLRRYGWSAKLPLSILTDFEELAVYDCRIKPVKTDKASHSRIIYMKYTDYVERWNEIKNIFSREAILKGSFDKYAQSQKTKRGTTEVDTAFLQEIERWRDLLAHNIALRNPDLSQRELNFSVQQTIDRIVFLRICEDRGIEPYGRLMELQKEQKGEKRQKGKSDKEQGDNHQTIYQRLFEIFKDADDKYNSGLFHFKPEKEHDNFDSLTPKLSIDDNVLKDIFKNLYYPDSPYEFAVLPADILGQVYEKFLGKIIRLTPNHQAVVEEKPEVRKAGGVYYTPTYIVDYIVKNTVGKLLEGRKQKGKSSAKDESKIDGKINSVNLKILDPACGSGSFLIGAYQFLLDWHLEQYLNHNPAKWAKGKKPVIYQTDKGEWRLTTDERKRILLNNIYGVDIDSQAVEVTKLSLLLKMLEGENDQSIKLMSAFQSRKTSWSNQNGVKRVGKQMAMFKDRVLPDLENNIKCGNSLIGPDFYDTHQTIFNEEEIYRVNAFDWNGEFPEIMKNGGFDAVVGNPPYIRIQTIKAWAPLEVEFYKKKYISASKGNYDIYVMFVEKGLSFLNQKGLLGFILPHKFFNSNYGEPLRNLLSAGKHLSQIVHFGDKQVFSGATTYTCLLFLDKSDKEKFKFVKVDDLKEWHTTEGVIPSSKIGKAEWNFIIGNDTVLFERLQKMAVKLGDIADIFVGLQTSADNVFIMDLIEETDNEIRLKSKSLDSEWIFEKDLLFPLLSGTDVNRYRPLPTRQYILFPYKISNLSEKLIDFELIKKCYPKTAQYLIKNKKQLKNREQGKFIDNSWYRFGRNQNIAIQGRVKLCVPRLVDRLYAAYDKTGEHFLDNVDVGGITYKAAYQKQGLLYLLGLLNSKLLRWYFPNVSAPFRGGWLSANRQFISQLPIRIIDFNNPNDKTHNELMVSLVDRMLELHKKLKESNLPRERTVIARQIETTDRQIDQLVYKLYDLTDEEIKIVEE
ncbi:MAG: Eco57I restriction-modification methylase domain-containing protein [Desulfamplus sp.]|nr:Eco57I restriction-modification methylase domain-containing protein [Desulfamplus sp.]